MAAPDTEHASDINVTRARQGRRGMHVFWVLVISTVAAAAVLGVIWMFQANRLSQVNGQGAADQPTAARFDAQAVPNPSPANPAAAPTPVSR